jgi:hypothetical protein
VLNTFPVPVAVVDPEGLAVAGATGGGRDLWVLDAAPGGQVHRLNPFTGFVQNTFPEPSVDSVGLGATCVVPANTQEVFVVANDPANPGTLYWVAPDTGAVINQCSLGVPAPQILDATAFALGNNATGVCFLVDLPPLGLGGGTRLQCVNKITCAQVFVRDYPWDGWGLGGKTFGTTTGTVTILFASDRGADILHALDAVTGDEQFTIPLAPGVTGINVRGVGGDNTCEPRCGDLVCNGGETCSSCPGDCGACPPFCGDGGCNGSESCATCVVDCGNCPGSGVTDLPVMDGLRIAALITLMLGGAIYLLIRHRA